MSDQLETLVLRKVLSDAERFPWSFALYLPADEVWSLRTKAAVLDPDDCDDSDDVPAPALEAGLSYALSMQQVQDVCRNAIGEGGESAADPEALLAAFLYFYDNDAFLR